MGRSGQLGNVTWNGHRLLLAYWRYVPRPIHLRALMSTSQPQRKAESYTDSPQTLRSWLYASPSDMELVATSGQAQGHIYLLLLTPLLQPCASPLLCHGVWV